MNNDMNDHEVERISLNKIKISRNSRTTISNDELEGLMASIKQTGLLQPIGLIKRGNAFEIAFGNRRFLACSKLGWATIPAIVRDQKSDFDIDIQNLTENIQRRNLGLVEIGRYISLLKTEGLSEKECAVRLGVTPKYVDNCLLAFEAVPEAFRNDIEVRTTPRKGETMAPGKISIAQATAIINQGKRGGLSKAQRDQLFKTAKFHGDKFKPEQVQVYAANLRCGKDPMSDETGIKTLNMPLVMPEKEYNRLLKKHIQNGPFRSISALMRGIIKGEISEHVKLVD